jgi:hypothetical protein
MDYLPIQASAVPCERAFSSSAETDTKRRNRLGAHTMESLQMLKFELKKERAFIENWITPESMMGGFEPEADLLGQLLTNNDDAMDLIIKDHPV